MGIIVLTIVHPCAAAPSLIAGVQPDQHEHIMRKAVYNSVTLKLMYVIIFSTNMKSVEISTGNF